MSPSFDVLGRMLLRVGIIVARALVESDVSCKRLLTTPTIFKYRSVVVSAGVSLASPPRNALIRICVK